MEHGNNYRSMPHGQAGFFRKLMDKYAPALTTIDELHRATHDGMVFNVTGKHIGLAAAASLVLLVSVPDGAYPHMNRSNFMFSDGDIDVVMRKNVTQTDEGTELLAHNVNTASSNVALTKFYYGPTITVAGDVIHLTWVPSTGADSGEKATGIGHIGAGEEWVLAPGDYTATITNNTAGDVTLAYDWLFYELSYT